MSTPESDTTPIALTAALYHEAGRIKDHILCGMAKAPWDQQPQESKNRTIQLVARIRSWTFVQFYDWLTTPLRMTGKPVAPSTNEEDSMVRHARMLYGIVHGLLEEKATVLPGGVA